MEHASGIEQQPKPIDVPLLDPSKLTDDDVSRISQVVHDAQQRTWERLPPEKQSLQVLPEEEIAEIIRAGGLYCLVDQAGAVEFSCYVIKIGMATANDLGQTGHVETPVYRAGGLIVRDQKKFPRYKKVFRHPEYPTALIIAGTHPGVAKIFDESWSKKISQDEFRRTYPRLAELFYAGYDTIPRSGDIYLRFPLSQ